MGNSSGKLKRIIVSIIVVLLFLLIGLGVYSYFNFSKKISVSNIKVSEGKLYPTFSSDVKEYQLYTDLDEITINCDSYDDNVKGCNENDLILE